MNSLSDSDGVDAETLRAYDTSAAAFAHDWHAQPAPIDLHDIVRRFFAPGPTADIGCGSGREVAWLHANGYPALGYDPSHGLLAQARERYPALTFRAAALPELAGISDNAFANVLCETVLMHLPAAAVTSAVQRLLAIVKAGGILYLSWRVSENADRRDNRGRLYAALDADTVRRALAGATVLLDERVTSASSGHTIQRLIVRKPSDD